MVKVEARYVEKPWGHELIWAETERYVGKILHIDAGEALSVQYHVEKDETIHVLSGRLQLSVGESVDALRDVELTVGEGFRIRPGIVHRMTALEETDVLEASTAHLDDLVRLEDRYGRTSDGP